MFTDHGKLPDRNFVDQVAKRSGKTVLRGAELNIFVDAWSKPSGKVEKNLFFHLLVGFDPNGTHDPDFWLTYLHKECENEFREIGGNKVQGFTASVDNICNGTRTTYVLMETPTFSELKAGLEIPFRVSLVKPSQPESFIIGLNIRGQFYSNLWLSLSPHCNALIGVKGSGKTSVLECLRFALGAPVPSSRQEGVSAHLQSILGAAGTVRVLIKRKDGAKVIVERTSSSPQNFKLTFEGDRQTLVENPDALMFPSYILGWHEIEQAATDPNIRQVYLDTIAGREQIRQLQERADTGANQVRLLHAQVTGRYTTYKALNDQIKRLDDLRSGLTELTEANLIELRDAYELAVGQREAIAELKRKLSEAASNIDARSETFQVQSEVTAFQGKSPVSPFAEAAASVLSRLRSDVTGFVDGYRKR